MKEILKVIKIFKHKDLKEIEKVTKLIKGKLNSDNPILAVFSDNKEFFSQVPQTVMEKIIISPTEDIETEPDKYLKSFDIIWRKMPGTPNYHAAVYLGNKKVAHISSFNSEDISSSLEKEDKEKKKLFGNIVENKKNFRANIDSWENFLSKTKDNLIRYHPVIPFKRPEEIVNHIKKTILLQYGNKKYNLLFENCEHFATLCVCGVSFSEQADKFTSWFDRIDLEKEIKENNKILEELKLDESKSEEQQQAQVEQSPK